MSALYTWSGTANQWECDELGHLNMRHYLAKAAEARQMFITHLGLPDAFKAGASSSVRLKQVHIKYVKEARPGASLYIESGLLSLGENCATLVHIMYHANGQVAASLTEKLEHIFCRNQQPFPWPDRVRSKADSFKLPLPDIAKPKGLTGNEPMIGPELAQLEAWNCQHIGTGMFLPDEVDIMGSVKPSVYIGRVSDNVIRLTSAWPDFDLLNWEKYSTMGVMLELRLRIHRHAVAGEPFLLKSGIAGVSKKTRNLVHNFVNPISGTSYATILTVNGVLDLNERKLVAPTASQMRLIKKAVIPSLTG